MSNLSKAFKSLKLSPMIEEAIQRLGYKEPTEVQKQAIPACLTGQDLVVSAQTGTGKTAAFCFPTINSLVHSESKRALILVPTREIGVQIRDFIKDVTEKDSSFNTALIIGGEPMKRQEKALSQNPKIIIASPGRLVDLMERRLVDLKDMGFLIVDEADRLLDMGFTPQLNQIVNQLPIKRQTLLFSATINNETLALAKAYTRKAGFIEIRKQDIEMSKLKTNVLNTTKETKFDNLLDELNARPGSILIFAKTKAEVEFLFEELSAYAYPVKRIHGDRTQSQRNSAVKSLKTGDTRVLVATDVAARGLDIPAIGHVFNYDPPQMPEDYVHRIGRTARAGASGEVLNFYTAENTKAWESCLDNKSSFKTSKPGAKKDKFSKTDKKKSSFSYRGKSDKSKSKSKSKSKK